MRKSWPEYFMEIAFLVSERSTCKRRKVGAIAVLDNRILASGYNGAPKDLPHCLDIGCVREQKNIPSGNQHELCRGIHAEMNLICQAAYFGIELKCSTIYCTTYPCSICAKLLANIGVSKVIYNEYYPDKLTKMFLGNKLEQFKKENNNE